MQIIKKIAVATLLAGTVVAGPVWSSASVSANVAQEQTVRQTQADSFTRYELLAPESGAFRIYYDVSATTRGGQYYYNPIREGASSTVNGVFDRATGDALKWQVVDGKDAQKHGLPNADPKYRFIKATLPKVIPFDAPDDTQTRLLIDKTYTDRESYFTEDAVIVFKRRLGIKRNRVVLPAGYELVSVNYPSQVREEADGRIAVSFYNAAADAVNYEVKARPVSYAPDVAGEDGITDAARETQQSPARPKARLEYRQPDRAGQTRDITYFLQAPESHSFRLFHDYTEEREGVDRYLNIVRPGSRASDPSAYVLDTGETLKVETLQGVEITERGIDIGEPVTDATELVVIWFDAVKAGESKRLRIWETYTDPGRYLRLGNRLLWDRSFGRSQNTLVLPQGWSLTDSAVPATISLRDDGRVALRLINDAPGVISVHVQARLRAGEGN